MHSNKHIALILADTLQSTGLQCLLTDYFSPVEVSTFATFALFVAASGDSYDYYFTQPDTFLLNADFFLPRRGKTVVLINEAEEGIPQSTTNRLSIRASKETILEQLQQLFASDNAAPLSGEGSKGLSAREIDVLQLIVKGITNKEIADKLSISLNTVLTHRKNITSKLGIKTVSGLTFYAIMNGFASSDDLEL
ncbi:MAG: LuxR C-terminal-related transcriptional regulator [Tannerellaceae bacterium]